MKIAPSTLLRAHPFRDGFLVFSLLVIIAVFGNWFLYSKTASAFVERVYKDFNVLAVGAASLVDGDMHNSLVSSEEETGETYKSLVAPLNKLRDAIPDARFIYTTRLIDGKVYFIVDSTLAGDKDGDGVEDHSSLMDLYDDADNDLIEALRSGKAAVSKKPYTDKWGTFMSAYAPIHNAMGHAVGSLCIDLKAEDYLGRLSLFRKNAINTLMIQVLMSALLGIIVYWLRLGSYQLALAEKKAQEALRESAERFQILNQVINDVVWDWDMKTGLVHWNDCVKTVLRYENQSVITSFAWWEEKVHAEDRERAVSSAKKVIDDGASLWSAEYRFLRGDGGYADILDRGIVIRDAAGVAMRMIGTMMDMTERKKIEAKLLQSQKMDTVGTLAGGIAHDLNNQLTPVRGYLDMILEETPKDHPTHVLLSEANRAAEKCVEMVQRLLNFSRSSTKEHDGISLLYQMKELKIVFEKFLPATISVDISCPEDVWPILGNDTELQTVFLNLAANARDAMRSGGRFSISVRNMQWVETIEAKHAAGKYVEVKVKDTGGGIPEELMSKIFEPFFTTKKRGEGTGLGLAMVFKIIADHKGWIDVSSREGEGTTFLIYLPAQLGVSVKSDPRSERMTPDLMGNGELILFVDDEEVMRNLGRAFLERLGYRVIFAANGEEAVQLYTEHLGTIALIIMDMTMPKMTGRECISRLLKIDLLAKILLMTGYTDEGAPEELIRAGAKNLIQKPYTIHSLASFIKKSIV